MFDVSTCSYFLWLKAGPSDRWKKNEALLIAIMANFEKVFTGKEPVRAHPQLQLLQKVGI
jgi:hypothetical protein